MSTQVTIYSNGISLFSLPNYSPAAGACHVNGITIHSTVDQLKARAMHANGAMHRVYGIGDSKALQRVALKRGMKLGSFAVH